jgi:hypothetical protein
MDFGQVVQACYDFTVANGGTIQSYPAGTPDRVGIESRTSRTEFFIGRDPLTTTGAWEAFHVQDASGAPASARRAGITTEHDLLAFVRECWNV